MNSYIDAAISRVIGDFQVNPQRYFTEEDVRWQLMKHLSLTLLEQEVEQVQIQDGVTSALHGEYPTPFRCSMAERSFALAPSQSKAQRGHFDIVLLEPAAIAHHTFEVVRSQYYQAFLQLLPHLHLPFLECVMEVKLYRDLAHPNRTESPGQQAEYAVQAVMKVAAALDAQLGYYHVPFAHSGTVLLFDNSNLACSAGIVQAREYFRQIFEAGLDWVSLPNTLSCTWVSPDERREYRGTRPPRELSA